MNSPHHARTIKYDLSFSSLPWMLTVHLKPGKHIERISDIDFELQLMNVNFVFSSIIWGDGKTNFV